MIQVNIMISLIRNFTVFKLKIISILKWSEKYTKTDMVYFTKSSFWVTFGQIASSTLSLILIILFANLLPKETYGTYKYILSIVGMLNVFTLTGMNSAVTRAVANGNDGTLRASVKYQLKWNLLMFVVFLIISGYYFFHDNKLFAISFLIFAIFTPLTLAFNTYGSYLEGKKNFKFANIASVISSFIYIIGITVAILLSGEVIWLVIAYAITTFFSTFLFYLIVLYKFKPPTKSDVEDTLKYGRELTFISFISPVASQIDKIILAHFWGPAQLAVYSLATAVPDRATSFIKNLVGIGFPKFSIKTAEEINTIFYKRIFQGFFIGTITAIIYIFLAPYVFKYLLPQYLDSIFYSQILAVSFIFAMPNRYLSLIMVSQRFSRQIFISSIIQNITRIILYLILGIWGGIMGLVLAFVSMSFFGLIINIIIWKKIKDTKYLY